MKTNDVTGRFRWGYAGIGVEMGRPGVSSTFKDLQTVAMALAGLGVEFEEENPVTALMVDKKTGKVNEDVLNERVLSAIIECKIETERLKKVLEALKAVSTKIDTVWQYAKRFNSKRGRVYPKTKHQNQCRTRSSLI